MTGSVLYVIPDLNVGGAERHLSLVAPGIKAAGFQVSIYTLIQKGNLAADLQLSGVEVIAPPLAGVLRGLPQFLRRLILVPLSATALWWLLVRRRFDVVHYFLPSAYLLGGMISLLAPLGARVMSRRSLNIYMKKAKLLAKVEPWLHRRMDAVLGNSGAVVNDLAGEGVSPERLALIPNGIEAPRPGCMRKDVRADLEISQQAFIMTLVANLFAYKGHADLLLALAGRRDQLPDGWVLLCIGIDKGQGEALKRQSEQLGLSKNIRWLGERDDVPDLLAASDLSLLVSHEEGFSNAVLEGMAAGLSMVVTDVGGNPEAVIDGETGLVVPAHAPEALGAAVVRLAGDRGLRTRFGEAGLKRFQEKFTLARCVQRYVVLYRGLMGKPPRVAQELLTFKENA